MAVFLIIGGRNCSALMVKSLSNVHLHQRCLIQQEQHQHLVMSELTLYPPPLSQVLAKTEDLRTSACCTAKAPPTSVREALAAVPDEVVSKYYGCGSPLPQGIRGLRWVGGVSQRRRGVSADAVQVLWVMSRKCGCRRWHARMQQGMCRLQLAKATLAVEGSTGSAWVSRPSLVGRVF
jgi:hypothetical protein